MNKYTEEQTGQGLFSIQQYNLLLLFCMLNMNFLSSTVVEISLTKNVEREKNRYRENKQEKAGSQSHNATSRYQFSYKTLTFNLK